MTCDALRMLSFPSFKVASTPSLNWRDQLASMLRYLVLGFRFRSRVKGSGLMVQSLGFRV